MEVQKAPEAPRVELPASEVGRETETFSSPEKGEMGKETTQSDAPVPAPSVSLPDTPEPVIDAAAEHLKRIEDVLAEDLGELYVQLPDELKPSFKAKGEEVARTIQTWMSEAKLVAGKVLDLIRGWLKMAPGLSKLYLEQESKIKTDQIMRMAEEGQEDVLL